MKRVTKIVVNGTEYDGVDQMPPDVRQEYEELMGKLGSDADGDGVPDVLQKPGASNVVVQESTTYNGRKYHSRDELPPEVRELLDHMPKPGPGADKTSVEVKTTQVFEPQVRLSTNWSDSDRPKSLTLKLSWFLVLVLLAAVIVLLFFWLSGVKLAELLW